MMNKRTARIATLGLIFMAMSLANCARAQQESWSSFEWAAYQTTDTTFEKGALLVPIHLVHLAGALKILWMQLDTGSDASLIYGVPFSQLNCTAAPPPDLPAAILLDGALGTHPFRHFPFLLREGYGDSLREGELRPLIGSLRIDFLRGKLLVLDFPRKRFCLTDTVNAAIAGMVNRASFTSINSRNNKLFIRLCVGDYESEDFFFDTGSSIFPLSTTKALWQRLTKRHGNEADNSQFKLLSWGKEAILIGAPAEGALRFAQLEIKEPMVYFDSSGLIDFTTWPFKADGLIGNALFYNEYIVILDLVKNRFALLNE